MRRLDAALLESRTWIGRTARFIAHADQYHWRLQAWAVFPNHYHFVAVAPNDASTLPAFISSLHTRTATQINSQDGQPGRKIWYQYWDTHLTFPASYSSRLAYVHRNPVHHGLVKNAPDYARCSAAWLERKADSAFRKRILAMKCDKVRVEDNFDVDLSDL